MTLEDTLTTIGRGVKTAVATVCDVAHRLWEGIRSRVKNLVGSLRRLFEPQVQVTIDAGERQRRAAVVETVRHVLGDLPLNALSSASDSERKDMLCALVNETSTKLHISPPEIDFRLMEAGTAGSCSLEHNRLTISILELKRRPMDMDDAAELLDTVLHELYHTFQYQAVQDPETCGISAAQARAWAENFQDYRTAAQDLQAYHEQPVESTAWAFAHAVVCEFWAV